MWEGWGRFGERISESCCIFVQKFHSLSVVVVVTLDDSIRCVVRNTKGVNLRWLTERLECGAGMRICVNEITYDKKKNLTHAGKFRRFLKNFHFLTMTPYTFPPSWKRHFSSPACVYVSSTPSYGCCEAKTEHTRGSGDCRLYRMWWR